MDTARNDTIDTGDDRHAIATYLSDMLALERHVAAPIEAQRSSADHQQYAEAISIIERIASVTKSHTAALEARLDAVGGHPASGIKSAWSQFLGAGAAAINSTRKTKVSKSLRDDYTALSLAAVSYTMLHATALGLGDRATAVLAKSHLDDVAPLIIEISRAIPGVVLQELRDDGENVQITAAQIAAENTGDSWRGASN